MSKYLATLLTACLIAFTTGCPEQKSEQKKEEKKVEDNTAPKMGEGEPKKPEIAPEPKAPEKAPEAPAPENKGEEKKDDGPMLEPVPPPPTPEPSPKPDEKKDGR